jgi:hypothetical protein
MLDKSNEKWINNNCYFETKKDCQIISNCQKLKNCVLLQILPVYQGNYYPSNNYLEDIF